MEKFIYFDLDGTLIHENSPLTPDTVNYLERLTKIQYGICTNRPLEDSKGLPFLKQIEHYICEGGVVSYKTNGDILYVHPSAVEINQDRILSIAEDFLNQIKIVCSINQNKSRVYTSTLTFDTDIDLRTLGDFLIKNYPLDNYHFIVLGKQKICLTLKSISKEYMIDAISKENYNYFLISDDEPKVDNCFNSKLDFISVNPDNLEYNERCIYIASEDLPVRLVDAIEFVINRKLI